MKRFGYALAILGLFTVAACDNAEKVAVPPEACADQGGVKRTFTKKNVVYVVCRDEGPRE